jgi:hypothetical protein
MEFLLTLSRCVTMRRLVLTLTAACAAISLCAPSALAAGGWTGKLDRYTSRVSFSVSGSRVVAFTVTNAPAYCLTGFSSVTIHVPSATLRAGRFAGTVRVRYEGETETIKLSGRLAGRSAVGSVHMSGPCDGAFTWSAHRSR